MRSGVCRCSSHVLLFGHVGVRLASSSFCQDELPRICVLIECSRGSRQKLEKLYTVDLAFLRIVAGLLKRLYFSKTKGVFIILL